MVGIIYIGDIRFCPYLEKYTSILRNMNIPFEIIFWDRNPQVDKKYNEDNLIIFKSYSRLNKKPAFKLLDFIKFALFLRKTIRDRKYNKLVVLTTLSAIFLFDVLIKYKKNFVLDYRDASYEFLPFYKFLLAKIIKWSYFTSISSRGFKNILPQHDYIIAHNVNVNEAGKYKENMFNKKQKDQRLCLGYVGLVRDFGLITKMMDIFSKDERFVVNFFGIGADYEEAKNYLLHKKYQNIYMLGYYSQDEKPQIFKECDILNYYYPPNYVNMYALANRYYDALIYKIPLWVCPSTYSGKLSIENGIAAGVDLEDADLCDKLFDFYHRIDCDNFNQSTKKCLEKILLEDEVHSKKIAEFFLA